MNLKRILIESAMEAARFQDAVTGAMPAGHNGPYNDPETPVRNTSHWAILFLKAYSLSNEERLLDAGKRAVNYLCSPEARPMNGAFFHRTNPEKDNSNGLIGQAWTIESLLYAANFFKEDHFSEIAEEVFLLHPFDENDALWNRITVEGGSPGRDETFNHQLWFGATGLLLGRRNSLIEKRCKRFLERLPDHLHIYASGLIVHLLRQPGWKQLAREIKHFVLPGKSGQLTVEKAIGYHLFNLYAFAIIKQLVPDHALFNNRKFKRALGYACSKEFEARITHNPFGYPYNPPGFEMAYVMQVFGRGSKIEQTQWIERQIDHCYNPSTRLMDRNSPDKWTQAARLYEVVRWLDENMMTSIKS